MTITDSGVSTAASALRRLYFFRAGFAVLWAIALTVSGSTLTSVTVTLLVLYPAFDLAAAVWDFRTSRTVRPAPTLYINMALSLLAAIGLLIAAGSGSPAVMIVWGAWAITAGAVQLVLAITRRRMGGQWPMILSGGISVLAGSAFVSQGLASEASIASLAGYAVLGGVFFFVSALRLGRASKGEVR
jgi:uncharacterized membrane protein HdeD (DUF308 family)